MFVALTQRIKNTIFSRFKILNKFFKKNLFFEFRNFKESFYNQKQEKIVLTNKTRDVFAIASCQKSTNKLSLRNLKRVNDIVRNKRIYYNCEKKKYIARDCLKSSKKTQVNIVKSF